MNPDEKNISPLLGEIETAFEITELVKQQKVTNVYLSKEIGPPSDYIELIDKMRSAQPQDLIYIHLNTPGGYVDTGVQIINAMRDCPARIITVLDGTVCSMGSLIFLAADEFIVHENCRLMFHNYSGGTYGKGNEQIAQLESTVEWFTNMFYEVCFPFLDEDEVDAVILGHDIWLSSTQVKERLDKMVKYMEKAQKELADEEAAKNAKTRKKELMAELKKIEAAEKKVKTPTRKTAAKPNKAAEPVAK